MKQLIIGIIAKRSRKKIEMEDSHNLVTNVKKIYEKAVGGFGLEKVAPTIQTTKSQWAD